MKHSTMVYGHSVPKYRASTLISSPPYSFFIVPLPLFVPLSLSVEKMASSFLLELSRFRFSVCVHVVPKNGSLAWKRGATSVALQLRYPTSPPPVCAFCVCAFTRVWYTSTRVRQQRWCLGCGMLFFSLL